MQPYGGFWVRVMAYIIDAILLYVATFVISLVLGLGAVGTATWGPGGAQAMTALQGGASLLAMVFNWLYFALMESSPRQATVGKIAMGLVVTDEHGERIGFGRATGRYFGKIVSSIILGIGFLMVGWTERKQGLHDMMAGTLVYKARSPELVRSSAAVFE